MNVEDWIGDKVEYDEEFGGGYILGVKGDNLQMIMDINLRGWGDIQHRFKTEEEALDFQDEVGRWIADAINEKLNTKEK